MDFFDNAVNKAKETFDVVSKKTGEIVAIEKQKFDVSALKSKLEKDYSKLGKYYFDNLDTEGELSDELKELVNAIKEKQEAIAKLNADIAAAKMKRVCPVCQTAIPDNARYCNNCGEKLIIDSEEQE